MSELFGASPLDSEPISGWSTVTNEPFSLKHTPSQLCSTIECIENFLSLKAVGQIRRASNDDGDDEVVRYIFKNARFHVHIALS